MVKYCGQIFLLFKHSSWRCLHLRIQEQFLWHGNLRHLRYSEVLNVRDITAIFFHVVVCCLSTKDNRLVVCACFKSLPKKIWSIVESKIRTSTNFWKMWRTFMSVCPTCMSRRSLPYLSTISEYGQLVVSVFTSDLNSTSNLLASATIESNKINPETGENIPLTPRWE